MRGKLITFEGIDGSGKTTMLRHVASELERLGIPHVVTREPGGTDVGAVIRDLVLAREMGPLAELFLYAADRAEHVERVIRPALREGRIVLCDRYADATVAYQGYGRGLPLELVRVVNQWATDGLLPDLTIVLDCAVEVALARRRPADRWDRFERDGVEFLERVRQGYLEIARAEPERMLVISASEPEEVTARQVWEIVASVLHR
ncbi:MAG: dTMP kinase [Blastocatellia bacterium]|nr:dTMP kinase [Blastocatellia bacterium]